MKKFIGIFIGVILLIFVLGIGGLYVILSNPANRQAFANSFVASARPTFLRSCIASAHQAAQSQGPEIDQRIEAACHCADDKMMASVSSQSSISAMGAAISRMVTDSRFQQEVAMSCLEETK